MHGTEYISIADAARQLGIDAKTLLSWFKSNDIEYLKVETGATHRPRYRVRISVFEKFKETNTVRPAAKRQPGRPPTTIL